MKQLLAELEKSKTKPVIVEGKNDRESLEFLGFEDVTVLGGPLYKVVEEFQHDEVIILTDLDRAGKKLYGRLASNFMKRGIKVDNTLREMLFKTKLRQIEGLKNYLRRNINL